MTARLSEEEMIDSDLGQCGEALERLRAAALAMTRAYDANVDAINGIVHEGPHDDALCYADELIHSAVDHCARCGGEQYGASDNVSRAIRNLKRAIGEPRRPYEAKWQDDEAQP